MSAWERGLRFLTASFYLLNSVPEETWPDGALTQYSRKLIASEKVT